jgi:hypothetical protein
MATKQFNSKGKLIEELDLPPQLLKKVEQNPAFQKVDLALSYAEPFLKVEKVDEEILAWCEYYLHSKKIERKLDHIYFPSTFKKGSA